MGKAAADVGSRFVLSVGDNFYPAGVRSVRDPQWAAAFEEVYTADSLQTPWYVALGNHDYRGGRTPRSPTAATATAGRCPTATTRSAVRTPACPASTSSSSTPIRSRRPRRDAQRMVRMRFKTRGYKRQMAWLSHELAHSDAPWKIVVGHHPVYPAPTARARRCWSTSCRCSRPTGSPPTSTATITTCSTSAAAQWTTSAAARARRPAGGRGGGHAVLRVAAGLRGLHPGGRRPAVPVPRPDRRVALSGGRQATRRVT